MPKNAMPKEATPNLRSSKNLRAIAEARVGKNSDFLNVNGLTLEATNQLLHELQVHQIELEMQNEELRESHIALDIARGRYFDLYDLAPVGYLTLNARGLIQQANLTLASLLNVARGALIQQPLSKFILYDDEDIYYLNHKKLIESGDPQSFDLRLNKNDHPSFWVNVVLTLVDDSEHDLELRVVIVDINARKLAEQALQSAMQIADKANLAKSEFLSSMSHELRTPLNAILGFAQLIEASEPPPTANHKRSIEQIIKAGWYLLALINEILDLAVVESGKKFLSIESLSLAEVLSDAYAMLEIQAQQRGINMHYSASDFNYLVKADRVRLKQVFVNLLSNAIKYNKPDGLVTLSCTTLISNTPSNTKASSQRIRICVEDTGEGLTANNVAQLFQSFNRLGQEFSKEEGTGIGLVVCKRIVEAMDGAIGVESTVGKGSVFWVELNLASAA